MEQQRTVLLEELSVMRRADVTFTESNGIPVLYTVMVVLCTTVLIAFILAVVLSDIITKPLSLLTARLRRISVNEFAFDPDIEKGQDEIAEMGRVINEMSMSISSLMAQQERMYEERRSAEIALLQSQVKPHFLYNTLDSIRWMATIQKNPGIVSMTRSLSNLMRNLAKGVGDKITLREELLLLRDYVGIQSIRYVETFRYLDLVEEEFLDCQIIKFTLQPLVENAIFHGIVPAGRYGTVTVEAAADGGDLRITVTDDGTGMTEAEIAALFQDGGADTANALSGIGVVNVDQRIRLQYGQDYGLSYESVPGKYTRAIVRIPIERDFPASAKKTGEAASD